MLFFGRKYKRKLLRKNANALRDAGQWARAAELYQNYLNRYPDDFGICVQCGHAEKESGAFERALECYNKALAIRPNDWDLHLQFGHLYKVMQRKADSADSYRRSLELNPDGLDAKRELSHYKLLAAMAGDTREHAPMAAAVAEAPPQPKPNAIPLSAQALGSPEALRQRINAEQAQGNVSSAAALMRLRVTQSPLDPSLWRSLADVLEQGGDKEQAQRCRKIADALPAQSVQSGA